MKGRVRVLLIFKQASLQSCQLTYNDVTRKGPGRVLGGYPHFLWKTIVFEGEKPVYRLMLPACLRIEQNTDHSLLLLECADATGC
jgi:hypothetical protein